MMQPHTNIQCVVIFASLRPRKKFNKVGPILKSEQDEAENLSILNVLLSQVDDQMKLLQDSWSEMLILDHMHHRMHNNLPDETQLPNGQVISMMVVVLRRRMGMVAVVVRMRMSVVVLFVRVRIIVSTKNVVRGGCKESRLCSYDGGSFSCALWLFFNLI